MNSATEAGAPQFWMGGVLARDLVEVSSDPSCLADGEFWAISTTYEGEFRAAKFKTITNEPFSTILTTMRVSGKWESSTSESEYIQYVEKIREEIASGGVYQVNACRRLSIKSSATLDLAFANILKSNPAPFASYFRFSELEIASASPELFLTRDGDQIKTSPIKGTKRSSSEKFGNKDRAENIMIVDLVRNDFGRVCHHGSVHVPGLLERQHHPGLDHLVSTVEGELRPNVGWPELIEATFAPGSVTGAPKIAAVRKIHELEPVDRNIYCGSIGWVDADRSIGELNVAIRTFWVHEDRLCFGTGGAITWDSTADGEWAETELKADRLIALASSRPA